MHRMNKSDINWMSSKLSESEKPEHVLHQNMFRLFRRSRRIQALFIGLFSASNLELEMIQSFLPAEPNQLSLWFGKLSHFCWIIRILFARGSHFQTIFLDLLGKSKLPKWRALMLMNPMVESESAKKNRPNLHLQVLEVDIFHFDDHFFSKSS